MNEQVYYMIFYRPKGMKVLTPLADRVVRAYIDSNANLSKHREKAEAVVSQLREALPQNEYAVFCCSQEGVAE